MRSSLEAATHLDEVNSPLREIARVEYRIGILFQYPVKQRIVGDPISIHEKYGPEHGKLDRKANLTREKKISGPTTYFEDHRRLSTLCLIWRLWIGDRMRGRRIRRQRSQSSKFGEVAIRPVPVFEEVRSVALVELVPARAEEERRPGVSTY